MSRRRLQYRLLTFTLKHNWSEGSGCQWPTLPVIWCVVAATDSEANAGDLLLLPEEGCDEMVERYLFSIPGITLFSL